MKHIGICVLLLFITGACSVMDPSVGNMVVMQPQMKIVAENRNGRISIVAGNGTERTYTWDGESQTVRLRPRGELWRGLTGIYHAASYPEGDRTRIVAQEGQLHVKSLEEAILWMAMAPIMDWMATADGLLVGFARVPERNQINVDVVQVYIQGSKPEGFPTSRESHIDIANIRIPEDQ